MLPTPAGSAGSWERLFRNVSVGLFRLPQGCGRDWNKKKCINLRNIYLQVEVTRTKNNNNKESEYKKHAKIIKYNMVHNVLLLPFFFFFFKCV